MSITNLLIFVKRRRFYSGNAIFGVIKNSGTDNPEFFVCNEVKRDGN